MADRAAVGAHPPRLHRGYGWRGWVADWGTRALAGRSVHVNLSAALLIERAVARRGSAQSDRETDWYGVRQRGHGRRRS